MKESGAESFSQRCGPLSVSVTWMATITSPLPSNTATAPRSEGFYPQQKEAGKMIGKLFIVTVGVFLELATYFIWFSYGDNLTSEEAAWCIEHRPRMPARKCKALFAY